MLTPRARVAKSVDARDLKSLDGTPSCQFESGSGHQKQASARGSGSCMARSSGRRCNAHAQEPSPTCQDAHARRRTQRHRQGRAANARRVERDRVRLVSADGSDSCGWRGRLPTFDSRYRHLCGLFCSRNRESRPNRQRRPENGSTWLDSLRRVGQEKMRATRLESSKRNRRKREAGRQTCRAPIDHEPSFQPRDVAELFVVESRSIDNIRCVAKYVWPRNHPNVIAG